MATNCFEYPCKGYDFPEFPDKEKGITVVLKWIVHEFSGTKDENRKFPRIQPAPQCDLEVSFGKKGHNLYIHVVNMLDSDLMFNATTTIYEGNGREVCQMMVSNGPLGLYKKQYILPEMRQPFKFLSFLDIRIRLDLIRAKGDKIWDKLAWQRGNEEKSAEDMKNWILAEHPSQIVLKTKDGQVSVNKAFLCARSSVFRKIFEHPLKEQDDDVVHVEDVNLATLKTLVEFLYTGKTELSQTGFASLKDVYYAANKYDVQNLGEICAQTILPLMTPENATGVLVLAHRHSDENLKKTVMDFMSSCVKEVLGSEDWGRLKTSDPCLVVEVLETYAIEQTSIQEAACSLS